MRSPVRTIAIVGAGFSGTVLAANLLRRESARPLRIVLIESREECGRGVAYSQADYPYLLNVPARRMSADSGDPLQFVRFVQARDPQYDAAAFLPRALYGDYLQDVLARAAAAAPAHIELTRIRARAESIYRINHTGPYLVSLSNQQRLLADDVVLACGYPPASTAAAARAVAGHPAYLCDPYSGSTLPSNAGTVLLIGAGLTMADIAVGAASLNPAIDIHAISRHGLLPAEQTAAGALNVPGEALRARLPAGEVTARGAVQAFRSLLRVVHAHGGDWRDCINIARHDVPAVWADMTPVERARFLRHLRARWDVHRHRMPPAIHARLQDLQQAGQFHLHAGQLLSLTPREDRIEVRWQERVGQRTRVLVVDAVINCAGADGRLAQTGEPLLTQLMDDGLAVPDSLGLGWQSDENGALRGRDGRVASHLFYVGPMLKARHWEATAVGELRGHVERLANVLSSVHQAV
jgi:uncharacterized NAD(P)/FAD-binding protein YdhS